MEALEEALDKAKASGDKSTTAKLEKKIAAEEKAVTAVAAVIEGGAQLDVAKKIRSPPRLPPLTPKRSSRPRMRRLRLGREVDKASGRARGSQVGRQQLEQKLEVAGGRRQGHRGAAQEADCRG